MNPKKPERKIFQIVDDSDNSIGNGYVEDNVVYQVSNEDPSKTIGTVGKIKYQ